MQLVVVLVLILTTMLIGSAVVIMGGPVAIKGLIAGAMTHYGEPGMAAIDADLDYLQTHVSNFGILPERNKIFYEIYFQLKCCGDIEPANWMNTPYYKKNLKYPDSCCKEGQLFSKNIFHKKLYFFLRWHLYCVDARCWRVANRHVGLWLL